MSISADRVGTVAVLTLDRPDRRNALDGPTADELTGLLAELRDDDSIRSLVVAGAGSDFCAGADLGELERCATGEEFHTFVGRLSRALELVDTFPKPVIAAVQGSALGGGFELALACDVILLATGARLGLPEIRLGLLPAAGGTQRLTRAAGASVAKQMLLTGESITAERAIELGLAVGVVPNVDLLRAAAELAASLSSGPRTTVEAALRLVDTGTMELSAAISYEQETVSLLFDQPGRIEGLRAFRARRTPRFV